MPPQVNARLERVQDAGFGESFDGPAAPGAELWAGDVGVYYREARDRIRTPEGEDRVIRREVFVDRGATGGVDLVSGIFITVRYRVSLVVGQVQTSESRELDGVPVELQTTRLTLEP